MNFDEYQKKTHKTAQYPTNIQLFEVVFPTFDDNSINLNWIYPALGLAAESGELLNILKKVIRDENGIIHPIVINDKLINELGDILWYVSELAYQLELSLDKIAEYNIKKLSRRAKNETIKGSGDDR